MGIDGLPTGLWVAAQLRRCSAEGRGAVVIRRGDPDAGAVLVKLRRGDGTARLLGRMTDLDGRIGWQPVTGEDPAEEASIDQAIERAGARDPDLWVLEADTLAGDNPFDL